ncbi:expansin-B4-like protein [Carex littledalei]|uniref:Expansin-B4-like protein n=1 Tax=Carex littledalei TaxID=544730 RepID=A0A833QJQ4_9POAL|nr:expansin-B4-like protein [Carex littledalei]
MASRLLTSVLSLALLSLLIPSALSGNTVSFHVEEGSNNIYFSVSIKYDGGDITAVELQETNSPYPGVTGWEPMTHNVGTIWRLDPNHPTLPPFSFQITDSKGKKFVVKDVIPPNWKPNTVYTGTIA